MKELQNLRKKPNGISVVSLALGTTVTKEEEITTVRLNDFEL